MTRIYLIRHGDAYDVEGIQRDEYPLNNYGKIQALQLAKRLQHNKFDKMYSSKIKRTIETCEIVNEVHNMDVTYDSAFNEIGGDDWPQPGATTTEGVIRDYDKAVRHVYKTFRRVVRDDEGGEVIIFGHGNWIRALLAKVLADGDSKVFTHFIISNTSLNIIDIDENGFEYIITVSDAAHTRLYESQI